MKSKEFRVLTLKEEHNLDERALHEYYCAYREYVLKRKLTNTTPGALTIAPKLKNITGKIAKVVTPVLCGGDVEKVITGLENIPDGPVIYACSHQGVVDNFAWIETNPKHSLILHSAEVKKLMFMVQANTGLVIVSKKDDKPESRSNAKLDMVKILLKGTSLIYFPEGAWNLSPNKLHLPMRHGFLDIAKKAEVPVIPTVFEYTYDSCTEKERITKIHIHYGTPIYVKERDSLTTKMDEYLEASSTIRFSLIEEKGIFKRAEISDDEYDNYLLGNLKNLKMGGIKFNNETIHLWQAQSDFYQMFPINAVVSKRVQKEIDSKKY